MEKFKGVLESYAEAVNGDRVEEADRAAIAALMMVAEEAIAHPTPDMQVAEEADSFLRAGDWSRAEEAKGIWAQVHLPGSRTESETK